MKNLIILGQILVKFFLFWQVGMFVIKLCLFGSLPNEFQVTHTIFNSLEVKQNYFLNKDKVLSARKTGPQSG